MNYGKLFRSLCTPAQVYFTLSTLSILGLLLQNTNPYRYRVGMYSTSIPHHNGLFFVFKILYVLIWTYILQELCKHGYKGISWFLVLLPLLAFFLIIGLFLAFHLSR